MTNKAIVNLSFSKDNQAYIRGGVSTWLFLSPMDEGGTEITACGSAGDGVSLRTLTRTALDNAISKGPETALEWPPGDPEARDVVSRSDFNDDASLKGIGIDYTGMPDHWYIFDGTYHWIAATLSISVDEKQPDGSIITVERETGVGVARLDATFSSQPEVRWVYDRVYDHANKSDNITTQDLWAVQRYDGGIAIGVVRSPLTYTDPKSKRRAKPANTDPTTLRVILVNEDIDPDGWAGLWEIPSPYGGYYDFSNGGSANFDSESKSYRLYLPATISVCSSNPVNEIEIPVSDNWAATNTNVTEFLRAKAEEQKQYGYSMPTVADLGNGYRAVTARRLQNHTKNEDPQLAIIRHASGCDPAYNQYALADDFAPVVVLILNSDNEIEVEVELTDSEEKSGLPVPQLGSRPHITRVGDGTLYVAYDGAYRDGGLNDPDGTETRAVWIAKLTYSVPDSSGGYSGRTPPEWWEPRGGYSGRTPPEGFSVGGFNSRSPPSLLGVKEGLVTVDQSPEPLIARPTVDCLRCGVQQAVTTAPSMLAQATQTERVDFPGQRLQGDQRQNRYLSLVTRFLGAE